MNELESKNYHWKFPYALLCVGILFIVLGLQNTVDIVKFGFGLGFLTVGITAVVYLNLQSPQNNQKVGKHG